MGAENYENMSAEDLEYHIDEKKIDLQRAELDLSRANKQLERLESTEAKAKESYDATQKESEVVITKYENLKADIEKDKKEAEELQSIIDDCNKEQVEAEEELHSQIRKMGITDREFDSLDEDLEKATEECNQYDLQTAAAQKSYNEAKQKYDAAVAVINDSQKAAKLTELKQEILLAVKKKEKFTADESEAIRYQLEKKYIASDDKAEAGKALAAAAAKAKFSQKAVAAKVGSYDGIMLQDGSFYSYAIDANCNVTFTALERIAATRPSSVVSCSGEADILANTTGKREGLEYELIEKMPCYKNVGYIINASNLGTMEVVEKYFGIPGVKISYDGNVLECTADEANGVNELTYVDSIGNKIAVYVENGIDVLGNVTEDEVSGDRYDTLAADANVSNLKGEKEDKCDVVLYDDVQELDCVAAEFRSRIAEIKAKGCKEGVDYAVNCHGNGTCTIIVADIAYEYSLTDISVTAESITSVIKAKADTALAYTQIAAAAAEIIKASKDAEAHNEKMNADDAELKRIKNDSMDVVATKKALAAKKDSISDITKVFDEAKRARFDKMTTADDKLFSVNSRITSNEKQFADMESEYNAAKDKVVQIKDAYDKALKDRNDKEAEIKDIKENVIPDIKKEIELMAKASGKTLEDIIGPEKPAAAPAPAAPTPAPAAAAPTPAAAAPTPAPSTAAGELLKSLLPQTPAGQAPARKIEPIGGRKEISLLGPSRTEAAMSASAPEGGIKSPIDAVAKSAAPTPTAPATPASAPAAPTPAAPAPKPAAPMNQTPAAALAAMQTGAKPAEAGAGGNVMKADKSVEEMINKRKKAGNGTKVEILQAQGDTAKVTELFGADGIENYLIVPSGEGSEDTITVNSGTRFKLDFDNPNILTEDGVASTWNRTKHAKIDNGGYISLKQDKAISSYKVVIEGTRNGKGYTLNIKVMNLCFAVTLQSMKLDSFMSSVKISLLEINTYAITELATAGWYVDGTELIPGVWVKAGKTDRPLAEAFLSSDNRTIEVKRLDGVKGRITVQAYMNGAEYHTPIQISEK